ncbi:MAG TPA: zinc metallopeptidase [Firmicutes bacterium]|nr:zinc metallopeptidase [Candidatus Fermentithermobacillaceae bacterium]
MPYLFFDTGYLLFVLPALIFAIWAQMQVRTAYEKYSRVRASRGYSAYEVAKGLLRQAGLDDVGIERIPGTLSDHYDPRSRTLRLSAGTMDSSSVAALAVAAHEVGHAVQHAVGYAGLQIRNGLVPVAQFASMAAFPLFIMGLFTNSGFLMDLGLLLFGGAVVFQVITLPVEYNASRRAMEMLEGSGYISQDEVRPVGEVLNAAALTYVAATAMAIAQFLRLLLLRPRRD